MKTTVKYWGQFFFFFLHSTANGDLSKTICWHDSSLWRNEFCSVLWCSWTESERLFSGTGKSSQVHKVGDDPAQSHGWLAQTAFSPHPFLRHTNFYILLAAPSQKPQHRACKHKPLPSRKSKKSSSLGVGSCKRQGSVAMGRKPQMESQTQQQLSFMALGDD